MCKRVETREIEAKTILTKAQGYLDAGFTHSLNPYAGCIFACKYCYVRELPVQKFREQPWGDWLDVKVNAAERYREEMAGLRRKGQPVRLFMSSATDPYQPAEREAKVTRRLLEAMLEAPPDSLVVQTRSPLVARDADLLARLAGLCRVVVSMTIETDREDMKRLFAPSAPGIGLRMKALKEVHDAGIPTQAAVSPVLPFTPEFPKKLLGIADRIWIDTMAIGDGERGRRSERLGMPRLFAEHGLSDWYAPDLHVRVKRYFAKFFPEERIRVSKEEAYPERRAPDGRPAAGSAADGSPGGEGR
jgi:DNA repair photolyase